MKKRKKPKRKESLFELAKRRPFIDSYDSYADEYQRWKRMDIVKGLVGIFELTDEQCTRDTQDLLPELGFGGYEQLFYTAEIDNTVRMDQEDVKGAGWTSAVKDVHGRVRPIVLIQRQVRGKAEDVLEEDEASYDAEIAGAIRLLVLMHEMGHAEDISRSINYDHENLKLDIVAAEAYAHMFVLKNARRLDYRLAMRYYIENLQEGLQSENEAVRLSSEKVLSEANIQDFKDAARDRTHSELRRAFEVSGRLQVFLASQS